MTALQGSRSRTPAGLILAIFVAPVVTALCFEIILLADLVVAPKGLFDAIGGALMFILFAFLFGGLLAALPVLVFGSIAVAVARGLGTKSPIYYAAMGLLAGILMAWVDTGRTKGVFNMLEVVPFVVGGCLSALAYWSVAER